MAGTRGRFHRNAHAVEKRMFLLLSLSAGVLEEILYRGYLISVLADGSSGLRLWIALIAAAMLFGMGHLYQGLGGIVRTFVIGLILTDHPISQR